jgi:hypothetical protein
MKIKAEKNRKGGQRTLCSSHCGPVRKENQHQKKYRRWRFSLTKLVLEEWERQTQGRVFSVEN